MGFGNLSGNQCFWFFIPHPFGAHDSLPLCYLFNTPLMVIRLVEQATDRKKGVRLYKDLGYQ